MSYIEILIVIIVMGIVLVPITVSMADNNLTTQESISLERAVYLAQGAIAEDITGKSFSIDNTGYNVVKTTVEDDLIKVIVTWKVAGKDMNYTIYGSKKITDYNS